MGILKTGDEVLAQALDAVSRGDFNGARMKFNEAANKFQKQNNGFKQAVAMTYYSIMGIALTPDNFEAYQAAVQMCRSIGEVPLKLGLYDTTSSQILNEAELLGHERMAVAYAPATPADHAAKAKKLQEIAMAYRSHFTGKVLIIPELFWKETTSGDRRALPLMAMAEESLGQSLVGENPKSAAEHFQTARLWWMQAGRQNEADAASGFVQSFGLAVKCWFCGREVSGENIHFVQMPSTLTDLIKKQAGGTALPAFNASNDSVYACKGCHGAIFKLSDEIAVQRTGELEAKLQKEIDDIKRRLSRANL